MPKACARSVLIDLHRVVNHQIRGNERICKRRVGSHRAKRIPHRRQIAHGGDAGEVLQQHARGPELDFTGLRGWIPLGDILDVAGS